MIYSSLNIFAVQILSIAIFTPVFYLLLKHAEITCPPAIEFPEPVPPLPGK